MRVWLALLGTLPLLAVGSGATASTSAPPRNGLIAAQGAANVAFGGPERKTLFITARTSLLAIELAIPGLPY